MAGALFCTEAVNRPFVYIVFSHFILTKFKFQMLSSPHTKRRHALPAQRTIETRRIIMDYQNIFKRHEMKYLLSRQEKERMLEAMKPYMRPEPYGHTCIRNIYLDSDTFRLIRRSLEKPVYKEKLRVRSCQRMLPVRRSSARPVADCRRNRLFPQLVPAAAPRRPAVFLSYEREA